MGYLGMMARMWNPNPNHYRGARRTLVEALLKDRDNNPGRSLSWYARAVCGHHAGYLHQYLELHKPKELSEKARRSLSNFLTIPDAQLMDKEPVKRTPERLPAPSAGPADLPVKGRAILGTDVLNWGRGMTTRNTDRHPSVAHSPDAFAAYVNGDTMVPRYCAGELVYVDPDRPVTPECWVFIVLEGDHAIIRQYVRPDDKSFIFRQLNPADEYGIARADVAQIFRIVSSGES